MLAILEVVALTGAIATPRGLLAAAALAIALLSAVLGTAVLGPRIARSWVARRLLPARIASGIAGQAFAFRVGEIGAPPQARAVMVRIEILFRDGGAPPLAVDRL